MARPMAAMTRLLCMACSWAGDELTLRPSQAHRLAAVSRSSLTQPLLQAADLRGARLSTDVVSAALVYRTRERVRCKASRYSTSVCATIAAAEVTARTPPTLCPADQMSFQRLGLASCASMLMSLAMSMWPRAGSALGSRPACTIDGLSMLVSRPVNAFVSSTSSALQSTSMALYASLAMLSCV